LYKRNRQVSTQDAGMNQEYVQRSLVKVIATKPVQLSVPFRDVGNPSPSGEVLFAIGCKTLSLLPPRFRVATTVVLTPDHGTKRASFEKLRPVLSTVRSFDSLRTNGVDGTMVRQAHHDPSTSSG
jgi:hypothetical protein